MKKAVPGQVGEEDLFQHFNPADGVPPIPEYQVALSEQLIDALCKTPGQKAAAQQALDARDRRAFDAIVHAKDWKDQSMSVDDVIRASDKIDQIRDHNTRERAYAALRDRDHGRLQRLLNEKD